MKLNEHDKKINNLFCPECHLATLQEHQEDKFKEEYLKCTFCGFVKRKEQDDGTI